MRFKTVIFLFVICVAICLTACDHQAPSSSEKQTYDQTTPSEPNTEDAPIGDTVPMFFTDYSDFLLFASKGELDPNKYPNAEVLLQIRHFDEKAFVDVKELFALPNVQSKGWFEEVIIEEDNEYLYYVYSKDEFNKSKSEYRIEVKFNIRSSDKKTYHESVVSIEKISDMRERSGTFVYKTNTFDIVYYKTEIGYKSVTLRGNNLKIQVFFEGDGLTQSQIASDFGGILSELTDSDTGKVNQTVTKLSDRLREAQREID